MLIIERIPDISPIPDHLKKVPVVLGWEERRKSRQRVTTHEGLEIGLALPTGTVLRDGDVLFACETYFIVVEAAKEDVIAVHPGDAHEWARAGFELGNRHLAVSIEGDAIMTPYDPGIVHMIEALGIPWEQRQAVFEPLRAAGHHVHA